jgi:hypothetical protein
MTTQNSPRPARPKSQSPAERSVELADAQRRLKREAAERRLLAEERGTDERAKRPIRRRG